MIPVQIDQGSIAWLEAETTEERDFIKAAPAYWSWVRVLTEWRKHEGEDHRNVQGQVEQVGIWR